MNSKKRYESGLTLIELMIAMAISIIVMAAIYKVYQSQQKAYVTQQMVIEMQQNARAAISLMTREIRMAGYKPAASDGIDNDGADGADDDDPNRDYPGGLPGVLIAKKDQIRFTMDIFPDADPDLCSDGIDNDGDSSTDEADECIFDGDTNDAGEDITYQLQANAAGDGKDLVRITSTGTNILAYDIEAIAFGYAFDWDKDALLDTYTDTDGKVKAFWAYDSGMGILDKNAEKNAALAPMGPPVLEPPDNVPLIGAVKIWILARTPNPIRGEADKNTYQVGDRLFVPPGTTGDVTYNPGYRRTLQTATVYCRNLRF